MKLKIFSILLTLLCIAFAAVIMFYLIPEGVLANNVRWLDFIIIDVNIVLCAYNITAPPINLNDDSHKQVGGLGIRWLTLFLYAFGAIGFMIINIAVCFDNPGNALSFSWQMCVQVFLLILLSAGILSSAFSSKKVEEIYFKETQLKHGKKSVRAATNSLLMDAQNQPGVPRDIVERLKKISENTRFISPSNSAEALNMDARIEDTCARISAALYDYEINKTTISQLVEHLENVTYHRQKAF